MHKSLFAPLVVAAGILTCILFYLAYLDDIAGQRSLQVLSPSVLYLAELARPWVVQIRPFIAWSVTVAIAVLLALGVVQRSASHMQFFAGLALAVATQFALIDESTRVSLLGLVGHAATSEHSRQMALWLGLLGYGCSFLLLLCSCRHRDAVDFEGVQSTSCGFGWGALCALFAAIAVGAVLRTYGLNHHLNVFEGELAPYSAGSTSLLGILYANRGYNGPWSPLGVLYYLPIYLTTSFFGTTLLALRLSSAIVGIATIPLVFLLANRIAGRSAGILAAALFSLNCLHIGWSRTDIHPHGVTTWPTILMCLFLLRAAETKKLVWALGVACMMGLSWHQYPSGQSAVIIPVLAVLFSFVVNRGRLPLRWPQLILIAAGVVLWVLGLPLSYYPVDGQWKFLNPFTLTGPRALWGAEQPITSSWQMALYVIMKALGHLWDFMQGVFFKVPYLFHQEWLPNTPPFLSRSVPWFVVSLAMTAVALLLARCRRFEAAVLFSWGVAALLPGVLSEHAYPKRLSTVFPLIDILAGVTFGFMCEYLRRCRFRGFDILGKALAVVTIAVFTLYSNFIWFSGAFFRYGEPPELAMASELKRAIPPKTIVIAGLGGGYEPGKFLYLMLDHLAAPAKRPNLFALVSNGGLLSIVSQKTLDLDQIAISLPYTWTKMRDQVTESLSYRDWENVTFIILETLHNNPSNTEAIALAQAMCANPTIKRINSSASTPEWTMVALAQITCKVSDLVQPLTLLPTKQRVGGTER